MKKIKNTAYARKGATLYTRLDELEKKMLERDAKLEKLIAELRAKSAK